MTGYHLLGKADMIETKKVLEWVGEDLNWLSAHNIIVSQNDLIIPQAVKLEYGGENGYGIVVARSGNRVVYFDDFNDEFAIGVMRGGLIKLVALYGDFRYAIQDLRNDEMNVR